MNNNQVKNKIVYLILPFAFFLTFFKYLPIAGLPDWVYRFGSNWGYEIHLYGIALLFVLLFFHYPTGGKIKDVGIFVSFFLALSLLFGVNSLIGNQLNQYIISRNADLDPTEFENYVIGYNVYAGESASSYSYDRVFFADYSLYFSHTPPSFTEEDLGWDGLEKIYNDHWSLWREID